MKNEKASSLVELLIVVAFIAIIAAIAVPRLLTARMAANEASSPSRGCAPSARLKSLLRTQNQQYTDMTSLVAGNSRFTGTGYTYTATCVATVSAAPIMGDLTPPTNFGVLAEPNTGLDRFTYGIAPDQVVRFEGVASGTTFPTGSSAGSPIGKTT